MRTDPVQIPGNSGLPVFTGAGSSMEPLAEVDGALMETLTAWENDPVISHYHRLRKDAHPLEDETPSQVLERLRDSRWGRSTWLLKMEDRPVGLFSAHVDPEYLFRPSPGTVWPGIVIGPSWARGRGLGRQAMRWGEEWARSQAYSRVELGVFEFNLPARKLYQSLDYAEIGSIPDFTWWNGRFWADVRMEKLLLASQPG